MAAGEEALLSQLFQEKESSIDPVVVGERRMPLMIRLVSRETPLPGRQTQERIESRLLVDHRYSEDLVSQDRLRKTILLWEDLGAMQVLEPEVVEEIAVAEAASAEEVTANVDQEVSVEVTVIEVVVVASVEVVTVVAAEEAKAAVASVALEQMHQGNE